MLEQTLVQCPYCGETITTEVDGWDSHHFIEDCPICCRPIEFHAEMNGWGKLVQLNAYREDD
ncbi:MULTISPECIES: CPXCG motif-containing cysteine-rich protein [Thiorhodovibrio]|uniref:CPXCG motif-containing cysteine-rich protein n=1 Tax=Thiorhodovibrio TaxID=61593 RepID=UPI0019139A4C|nr:MULTISPECIES: CPXCG motif-containing cysteine-rich protein [Thiorhodovibrio]MBK5969366.1 restriction endonuclease [Thiorhodovibrio winogradskyi]WPL13351.1 hypothetical protein Thiosp_03152 [Thiorhodovibrio litoralis]